MNDSNNQEISELMIRIEATTKARNTRSTELSIALDNQSRTAHAVAVDEAYIWLVRQQEADLTAKASRKIGSIRIN